MVNPLESLSSDGTADQTGFHGPDMRTIATSPERCKGR